MTLRGWFYIVGLMAFLAFVFSPAIESIASFDERAFNHGFKDAFGLGRAFGIEKPPRLEYPYSFGWHMLGGILGALATVIPVYFIVIFAVFVIREEHQKAKQGKAKQ